MPSVAGSVAGRFPRESNNINTYNLLETKGTKKLEKNYFPIIYIENSVSWLPSVAGMEVKK